MTIDRRFNIPAYYKNKTYTRQMICVNDMHRCSRSSSSFDNGSKVQYLSTLLILFIVSTILYRCEIECRSCENPTENSESAFCTCQSVQDWMDD